MRGSLSRPLVDDLLRCEHSGPSPRGAALLDRASIGVWQAVEDFDCGCRPLEPKLLILCRLSGDGGAEEGGFLGSGSHRGSPRRHNRIISACSGPPITRAAAAGLGIAVLRGKWLPQVHVFVGLQAGDDPSAFLPLRDLLEDCLLDLAVPCLVFGVDLHCLHNPRGRKRHRPSGQAPPSPTPGAPGASAGCAASSLVRAGP
mmetsp:Transcript_18086/g.46971  ORF Transcript_18086/g.46971 Transcript_18086/m.46971 type:complete len:201 (+) Transcript_18086:131-733(+)